MKLRVHGLHPRIIQLIVSWLENRRAKVIVGGKSSPEILMKDQVFQGTVLGPTLWDVYFEDVKVPVREQKFKEISFADDLNSHRTYDGNTDNKLIKKHAKKCQDAVHEWGRANKSTFDTTTEFSSII